MLHALRETSVQHLDLSWAPGLGFLEGLFGSSALHKFLMWLMWFWLLFVTPLPQLVFEVHPTAFLARVFLCQQTTLLCPLNLKKIHESLSSQMAGAKAARVLAFSCLQNSPEQWAPVLISRHTLTPGCANEALSKFHKQHFAPMAAPKGIGDWVSIWSAMAGLPVLFTTPVLFSVLFCFRGSLTRLFVLHWLVS